MQKQERWGRERGEGGEGKEKKGGSQREQQRSRGWSLELGPGSHCSCCGCVGGNLSAEMRDGSGVLRDSGGVLKAWPCQSSPSSGDKGLPGGELIFLII